MAYWFFFSSLQNAILGVHLPHGEHHRRNNQTFPASIREAIPNVKYSQKEVPDAILRQLVFRIGLQLADQQTSKLEAIVILAPYPPLLKGLIS
jgi:hypothetical protein